MSVLRVHLFGSVHIDHDRTTEQRATPSVQTLLAYLLLHRHRTHPRDVLTAVFWGDQSQERARARLNTTLWRLRRLLEPPGVPRGTFLVTASSGDIGFDAASDYWLDVAAFEAQVDAVLTDPDSATAAQPSAAAERLRLLYRGELLEGFTDDWALADRRRLQDRYVDALAALIAGAGDQGDLDTALVCGRQALGIDPLREDIHRTMMRLLARNGQRAQALRQFASCREVLAAEVGVAPAHETRALFESIAQNSDGPRRPDRSACGDALGELYGAIAELDVLRARVSAAIDRLEAARAPQPGQSPTTRLSHL